jgi:membrane-associated phospholipid phosphatase
VVLGVVLVAVFVDLSVGGPFAAADMWALRFRIPRFSPLRPYGNVLDGFGLRAVTAPALVALAFWLRRRTGRWRPLVLTILALLVLNVVVGAMKYTIGRGDPASGGVDLFQGGVMWPSGHAANVSMTWTMVVYLLRSYDRRRIGRWRGVAVVVVPSAFMTVISLVLGYHWLSDLIAGTIVGVLIAAAVIRLDGGDPWVTVANGHAVGDPSPLSTVRPLLLAPVVHLRSDPADDDWTGERSRRSA